MDERLQQVQLRQSQKLEALGTLAGGIAHDFNNILGAILGYGELAQQLAAKGSDTRRYLDNVMQAAGRAKTLVDRILAFSRSGMDERVPVQVQFVIEEVLVLLEASLPGGIQVEQRLEAADAAVIADATRLHQVVMNLCTNAVQAMEGGGTLSVTLEHIQLTQPRTLLSGSLMPNPYLRLVVGDTGHGIAPGVIERIFDPFFTTKPIGTGTGLGLAVVHGIVSDLAGGIEVMTKVGEGTRFEIWLPVSGRVGRPVPEAEHELPHGRGETVLIVDSDCALGTLTEEILAQLGYEPVGFASGGAAWRAFQAQPQRFDVVLCDETLRGPTGTTLAYEIRRLRPEVPVILMRACPSVQFIAWQAGNSANEILRKPMRSHDLAEALARIFKNRTIVRE